MPSNVKSNSGIIETTDIKLQSNHRENIEEEIKSGKKKGVTEVSIQFLRQNLGLELSIPVSLTKDQGRCHNFTNTTLLAEKAKESRYQILKEIAHRVR